MRSVTCEARGRGKRSCEPLPMLCFKGVDQLARREQGSRRDVEVINGECKSSSATGLFVLGVEGQLSESQGCDVPTPQSEVRRVCSGCSATITLKRALRS